MKIWHQGVIGSAAEVRVSVLDHGLLYGDGVFEGIRITGARIFRLDDHLARLARSAHAIGLTLPYELAAIRDAIIATARAHGEAEAYVRVLITRGEGALTLDPTGCHQPQLYCIVDDIRMFPEALARQGLRLLTAALRRPRGDMLDPQVKSLNYLNNVLAKRDARLKGFDDAVLLNSDGRVAEATGANVFAVIEGVLVTPPPTEGALPGLTRDSVMRCWRARDGSVEERPLSRYDLLSASEMFLSGSGAGLIGVASLDDAAIGDGARPVLSALRDAYAAYAYDYGVAWSSQEGA